MLLCLTGHLDFEGLTLAGVGPLAFQGPTAAIALLNGWLTTRLGEHGHDSPCRPGGTAKSTLRVADDLFPAVLNHPIFR